MAEEDRCPDCGQLRLAQERLLQQMEKEYKMRSRLTNEIAQLRLRVHELEVDFELRQGWNARKVRRQAKAIRQLEVKLEKATAPNMEGMRRTGGYTYDGTPLYEEIPSDEATT